MPLIRHVRALLLLLLLIPAIASAKCINTANPKAATLKATANLTLSGNVKADQYLGSFTFQRDGGTAPIAECEPGSEVYGYATYSESGGIRAQYYKDIDGRPTYYLSAYDTDYAYAIEDMDTGAPFSSAGTAINYPQPYLYPLNVQVHLYTTTDHPEPIVRWGSHIGALLVTRYGDGIGTTAVGFHHIIAINVKTATTCQIENNNLVIHLDPVSLSDFPERGYARSGAAGRDHISINCSGNMSAEIMVTGKHGTETLDGEDAILKIENEGQGNNAQGIGFVLSAPDQQDRVLINNKYVSLGTMRSGRQSIPLEARYYRYGDWVKPGQASSTASFVIQFN